MRAVLIDTNLLLLFIVGGVSLRDVGMVKGLKAYDYEAFKLLVGRLGAFDFHVSTPTILAETSNLLGAGRREIVKGATEALQIYVSKLDEVFEVSSEVMKTNAYAKFGLTDAAISKLSLSGDFGRMGVTVLTDDGPLYGYLSNIGAKVENLSHLRTPPD